MTISKNIIQTIKQNDENIVRNLKKKMLVLKSALRPTRASYQSSIDDNSLAI